jgi:phage tail-like protein
VAVFRDEPYGAFNFLVSLGGSQGDGSPGTIVGGFSEVTGLGTSVVYAEYRNGNDPSSSVRKIAGLNKSTDVTLKRGVIGSLDLFEWLRSVTNGTRDRRNVTITLLDEARNAVVSWRLRNAQPASWHGPRLRAKNGCVAIEELRIVCEGLDME